MKIREIYLGKGIPVVSLTIAILCIVTTIISQMVPSTYLAFAFTYPLKYPWQVISYIFLQGISKDLLPPDFSYSPIELAIGHLGFNLLLVLPFGILNEKVLGSIKFLILSITAWITNIACIYIIAMNSNDDNFIGAGASGLAFAFMPVGIYILFVLGKKCGFKNLFKQVSLYLLLPVAITTFIFAVSPSIAGVAGVVSMIMHLVALITGVAMTVIFRKSINKYIETQSCR